MAVDVVVVTKNRPEQLRRTVAMVDHEIKHNNIWIVENSEYPDYELLNDLQYEYKVKVVYAPNSTLGYMRNLALQQSEASYVAMVDDDISLGNGWFQALMEEFKDPEVAAANSKIEYGNTWIAKMCRVSPSLECASAGITIYDRKQILEVGNFNVDIHRGEDAELALRVRCKGKKWVKNMGVTAFHPMTIRQFFAHPKHNVCGWRFIMTRSPHKLRFILTRWASTFIMPIYYLFRTGDPRCMGAWLVYKLLSMFYWLSGKYVR